MKPRLRISSISDLPVCFRFGSRVSTTDIGRTSLIIYITAPAYQRHSFFNSQHVVSSSSAINDQTTDEALPRNEEAHTAGVLSREIANGVPDCLNLEMWRSCRIPRRFSRMSNVSRTSFIYFHPGKIEINSNSTVVRLKCTLIPFILPFLLVLPHQAIMTQLESKVPKCMPNQK
jgi:hypothetical protein